MNNQTNQDAIDIIRQMIADGQLSQRVAENYFPELKESEDDRIRRYITNHLQEHLDTCKRFTSDGMFPPFSASEIEMLEASVAWLERGQKSLFNDNKIRDIWEYIEQFKTLYGHYPKDADEIAVIVQEVLKQKPAEWSTEDERILSNIVTYMNYIKGYPGITENLVEEAKTWIKSLRSRYTIELNWEDIMLIHKYIKDATNLYIKEFQSVEGQKKVYKEVLKKFKG